MQNTLYYGDNLQILRQYIPDESVDLIYLDPPFNSNRSHNVLFKEVSGEDSGAQITAFEDTWTWGSDSAQTLIELSGYASHKVVKMVNALVDGLGPNAVAAYVVMMTARLVELHRVLKPTGSLYLHCDPTASHYLKIVLDAIFDPRNFRNEIVWKRTTAHNDPTRWGRVHDIILYYTKSADFVWNDVYTPYNEEYKERFRRSDPDGRLWTDDNLTAKGLSGGGYTYEYKGATSLWRVPIETMKRLDAESRLHFTNNGGIRLKRYLDELPGLPAQDVIADVPPINSQAVERLGYPTQKPLALLERIIEASSNPGDVVLDPFCGCGTAIHAAQKTGRTWLGIDITHLAISLIKYRLKDAFGDIDYKVIGEPVTVSGAEELAKQNRFQFEWWALSLIKAKPYQGKTKGADKGIDGIIYISDDPKKPSTKTIIVQVKSGRNLHANTISELCHVVEREKAIMGILITLYEPTKPMKAEAITAGFYVSPIGGQYSKVQILTIDQLLAGEKPKYPYGTESTFKQAAREQPGEQRPLF